MARKPSNPFGLYLTDGGKKSVRMEHQASMMTREFKKLWSKFIQEWRALQKEGDNRGLGASDTAAREDQAEWIRKHAYEVN
jgi:hypothetical protein